MPYVARKKVSGSRCGFAIFFDVIDMELMLLKLNIVRIERIWSVEDPLAWCLVIKELEESRDADTFEMNEFDDIEALLKEQPMVMDEVDGDINVKFPTGGSRMGSSVSGREKS
ncbi:hypothetical protein QVD17_37514 [Tagetes erecta]|uniref:Uncharacterized protein n=1 Tax=Tagetes erecta TaxID=13708 RepID=A0AAD8NJX9_TARER|nr:hypothetical protein QVD17_37514 [Tagetes erecta]